MDNAESRCNISSLPFEIIAKVFEVFVLDNSRQLLHPSRQLLLASVCTRWRDICFSLSYLWTRLKIYPCPKLMASGDTETLAEMVGVWLARAKNHPIDLRIDVNLYMPHVPSIQSGDLIVSGILRRFSTQFRHWDGPARALHYAQLSSTSLPLLESVCISWNLLRSLDDRDFNSMVDLCVLGASKKLTRMHLVGPLTTTVDSPPLALNVTELILEGLSLGSVITILQRTPHLEMLSLFGEHMPSPCDYVTLPTLHTLRLRTSWGDTPALGHLKVPGLETLEILGAVNAWRGVSSLMERSSSTLRRLRLTAIPAHEISCYLSFIPAMQSVSELEVVLCWNDEAFFTKVLHRLKAGALPGLHTLRIKACPILRSGFVEVLLGDIREIAAMTGLRFLGLELAKRHDWEWWRDACMISFRDLVKEIEGLEVVIHGVSVSKE
uniref:F-box domain-containing protein n=1 Tax=Mycena chlorophos TaxID=658473 RepID=A0ABQ0MCT9_MYCCL|nr:predicted protein [Mycena chlorophos]